jgi:hypothetical protein
MKYIEQRVEELETEVALLKAKNKLQEINLKTSYSDGNKFNFKEAMENIKTDFDITPADCEFMEGYADYPKIVGSWDDLPHSSGIEKKIEKEFGKIVSKFRILHHQWEMDGYGYIINSGTGNKLVITDHGKPLVVGEDYLINKLKGYNDIVQNTEKALSLII